MQYESNGVVLTSETDIPEDEAQAYIDYLLEKQGSKLQTVDVVVDGDFVDLKYTFDANVPFERIRRITGYLVGTLDRFNDAKRAEESDRVKHSV